jgi:hypothetical protein
MLQIENHTPFAPAIAVFPDKDGVDTLYVIVKATFTLSPLVAIAEVQVPPVAADEYWGEPGASSIKYPSEMHIGKQATDVVLVGKAWTANGKAAYESGVMVSVAGRKQIAQVHGDRVWKGRSLSSPEPFLSIPLVYECSFGGSYRATADGPLLGEERNPVGRGFLGKRSPEALAGQKAPNIEHLTVKLERLGDTPPPVGFGFVAPSWLPRRKFAGTYDKAWQKNRAPYLPQDFNPAFFNCAPPELVMPRFLEGGETIKVAGASRHGGLHFEVPRRQPTVSIKVAGATERPPVHLETVLIEPEDNRFCLTWRAALACDKKVLKVQQIEISS